MDVPVPITEPLAQPPSYHLRVAPEPSVAPSAVRVTLLPMHISSGTVALFVIEVGAVDGAHTFTVKKQVVANHSGTSGGGRNMFLTFPLIDQAISLIDLSIADPLNPVVPLQPVGQVTGGKL